MDTRYLTAARPESYLSMSGQPVLDPCRNHYLLEDGHRRTSQPEVCAWRVHLTVAGMQEKFVSHPLTEADALDYESSLRASVGIHAKTELRPVFGWPKADKAFITTDRETKQVAVHHTGPLAGEKWLHVQQSQNKWRTGGPAEKVARHLTMMLEFAAEQDFDGMARHQSIALHHAEKVACSDHQEVVQALTQAGLPAIPCKSTTHDPLFHENDTKEVA